LKDRRKKKKRETRKDVGKGTGKSDEAEESNTCRKRSKLANMAKNDKEPVTDVTLENV
jgi:hypothetical protein